MRMNGRYGNWVRLGVTIGILLIVLVAVQAFAQRYEQPPANDDGVKSSYNDRRNRGAEPAYRRNTAGDFDYYALVLSWSPTHCASEAGTRDDMQCNRQDGKRYSFIVHGLWPQYQHGYPQDCMRAGSSFVPEQVIDRMADVMPSKSLIIHEYRKHGSCSGLAPFAYFEFIRQAFSKIKIPERFNNPFESQFVTPRDVVDEFVQINPSLKADMIGVACGGAGSRLQEVHICLSKKGDPVACGDNENAGRMCRASKMFVPPARSSREGAETSEARQKALPPQKPLSVPRVIPWSQ